MLHITLLLWTHVFVCTCKCTKFWKVTLFQHWKQVFNSSCILIFISYAAHFVSLSLFLPFSLLQALGSGPQRDDLGPVKGPFWAPSKGWRSKYPYTKSEILALSCREIWVWSKRLNLYSLQVIVLRRKKKFMQHIRAGSGNFYRLLPLTPHIDTVHLSIFLVAVPWIVSFSALDFPPCDILFLFLFISFEISISIFDLFTSFLLSFVITHTILISYFLSFSTCGDEFFGNASGNVPCLKYYNILLRVSPWQWLGRFMLHDTTGM
jgi:hypothetical protein